MNYIGLDIHKRFTYAVVKDDEGNLLGEEKFGNSKENFHMFLQIFSPHETKIVMESTGVWEYIYNILKELGYKEVKLANPVKTKAIAWARVKTDAIDAGTLADLLRANLIAESYVPPEEIRKLREITRLRKIAVKQKTQMVNRLHALLTRKGIFLPKKTLCGQSKEFLKEENDPSIENYLEIIEINRKRLLVIDEEITALAHQNNTAKLLMTAVGIGPVRSITLVAEIGEITRFLSAEKLCSYAGLVPRVKQSGSSLHFGRLVQQASKTLKHALIQASWSAAKCRESNPLKEHYIRLMQKKGKQKAICATARKLCCIIFAMLKKQEEFKYA